MKNSGIYIVGAVVLLGGGAYLFLKNKQSKDADKVSELDDKLDDKLGGTTSSGTTPTGTTSSGTTPNLTEPVKIINDSNLDAYNIQVILDGLKKLADEYKAQPKKENSSGATTSEWYSWYFRVGKPSKYAERRGILLERLAKLGYKFENGLLIKI
jgi:hypothetical protein